VNWCQCFRGWCRHGRKRKAKETPTTFNARAETLAEKPVFRSAFKQSRCLIPASGYYEWQKTLTGKQPYY
jgi:putative SOS response-associated peptidase YedK